MPANAGDRSTSLAHQSGSLLAISAIMQWPTLMLRYAL
jgi:hypothetical protein